MMGNINGSKKMEASITEIYGYLYDYHRMKADIFRMGVKVAELQFINNNMGVIVDTIEKFCRFYEEYLKEFYAPRGL